MHQHMVAKGLVPLWGTGAAGWSTVEHEIHIHQQTGSPLIFFNEDCTIVILFCIFVQGEASYDLLSSQSFYNNTKYTH